MYIEEPNHDNLYASQKRFAQVLTLNLLLDRRSVFVVSGAVLNHFRPTLLLLIGGVWDREREKEKMKEGKKETSIEGKNGRRKEWECQMTETGKEKGERKKGKKT